MTKHVLHRPRGFVPDVYKGVRVECPPTFATNAVCEMRNVCMFFGCNYRRPAFHGLPFSVWLHLP